MKSSISATVSRCAIQGLACVTLFTTTSLRVNATPVKRDIPSEAGNIAIPTSPEAMPAKADPQMQTVLDKLASLGGKPITELDAKEARKQPSMADAVEKVMKDQGKKGPEKVDTVDNITIKLSTGDVKGRVYRPEGDGPFPVILYFHGGGWVLADLDTYDSTPRALANAAHALVISADYRHAPEDKFPAAHNDAFGAYTWTLENAGRYKGDASKVAIVGESAGGNLAANVSLMAMDKGIQMPVHEVLVYPVADTKMDTLSYKESVDAKPLNSKMMGWFFGQYLTGEADFKNPEISLLSVKSFKGMPSTTIIAAQIDPLRSEGEALAQKFKDDGVSVSYKCYPGVTHEFFGAGAVIDKAKDAVNMAATNIKAAFDGKTIQTAER